MSPIKVTVMGNEADGDEHSEDDPDQQDYFEDEDEDKGIEDDDFGEISEGSWSASHLQIALADALKLREEGNTAFRAGDYKLSTKLYSDASYDVLYLKGLRYLGTIPQSDFQFVRSITEMQFKACSNEAASWLKYEAYVPEEDGRTRFQMAHSATSTALDALKDHPNAWKPGDKELAKLWYRRALACEGLGDFEEAERDVKMACGLSPDDETMKGLKNKIKNNRGLTKLVI